MKPAPDEVPTAPEAIYQVEPDKFQIVQGSVSEEQAIRNTDGINHVLMYAKRWGYRKVVFPGGLYLLDPRNSISMRSNLTVDLNGSTWQIRPNAYARYALVRFLEMDEPNRFRNYEIAMKTVKQPDLSPDPIHSFAVPVGKTSILSNPMRIGSLPPKDGTNQVADLFVRGSRIVISSPIGVNRIVVDPGLPHSMEVRLKLNFYQGAALVETKDFGKAWLRNTAGKLWCDSPQDYLLRSESDYDCIRLELEFSLNNCTADIYFSQATVCGKVTAILENSRLCNGTILGERDFKEPLYPGWAKDAKTEGALAISFEEGRNNGIESMTVRKGIGFNMATRLGQRSAGAVGVGKIPLKYKDLEFGDFDEAGNAVESPIVQRTKEFLDFSAIRETFELGLPLGYMGYNLLRVRVYDILFYDADKALVERQGHSMILPSVKRQKELRRKVWTWWEYVDMVLHHSPWGFSLS